MKNADMPAMPSDDIDLMAIHRKDGRDESGRYAINRGMTKREYAAIKIMASLALNSADYGVFDGMARDAVAMADAVLEELEKSK